MRLVQHGVGECAEPVAVDSLDFRGTFDAVGTRSVCWNVKSLIGILRPIITVRAKNLVLRVQVIVHAAEYGGIPLLVEYRESFIGILNGRRKGRRLKEIDQGNTLAIGAGIDHRICTGSSIVNRAGTASSSDGRAEICPRQVLPNSFPCCEEEELVLD